MFFQEATPDTSGYMIAGYAIAFIVMAIIRCQHVSAQPQPQPGHDHTPRKWRNPRRRSRRS